MRVLRNHVTAFTIMVSLAVLMVFGVVVYENGGYGNTAAGLPSVQPAQVPQQPVAQAPGDVITYVATGSPALIDYGEEASDPGTVPMRVTRPMDGDQFYHLIASLDEVGGTTDIQILVDGTVICQADSAGKYMTVSVTVYRNLLTDKWVGVPSYK